MKITPVENKVFGAVVTDVALGSLSDDDFAKIEAAFLEYGFLVFPEQFLSNEDSIRIDEGDRETALRFDDLSAEDLDVLEALITGRRITE